MKIGSIIQWPSNTIPDGWLLCDGSSVSRTTYADLFSVIGTTYGSGDGSTTFNVPDYRDRVPVGYDANDSDFNVLGKTLGEKTHTLTIDEMPSHSHDRTDALYNSLNNGYGIYGQVYKTNEAYQEVSSPTGNTGGGQPHNIIQPSIVTNYIIKALNPDSIKISELESASSVTSSDVLPIVQSGETKKVTIGNLIKETYSTNETLTNKVWIDGNGIKHKVYRKVVYYTLEQESGYPTFDSGIRNAEEVDIHMIKYYGANNKYVSLISGFNGYFDRTNGYITFIEDESDLKPGIGLYKFIIEYTKTTE